MFLFFKFWQFLCYYCTAKICTAKTSLRFARIALWCSSTVVESFVPCDAEGLEFRHRPNYIVVRSSSVANLDLFTDYQCANIPAGAGPSRRPAPPSSSAGTTRHRPRRARCTQSFPASRRWRGWLLARRWYRSGRNKLSGARSSSNWRSRRCWWSAGRTRRTEIPRTPPARLRASVHIQLIWFISTNSMFFANMFYFYPLRDSKF